MTLGQAIILGIIQGLTEFLPISSTAHLRIVPALLGWPDPGAAFTAVIQLGTLVAVFAYFRRDIVAITRDTIRGRSQMGWMIAVGTIPVVGFGLLFKHQIESTLRSLYVIAAAMIGLALVLALAERLANHRRTMDEAGWLDAIVVGCAQAVALLPGASRSGCTITGALFMGFDRASAARFSFLLSLPAVLAAGVFEFRHALREPAGQPAALALATLVSFVVGYASIACLLGYLKRHTLWLFIVYRLALGAVLLLLLRLGKLAA
jgi:undecaprenyl-diphosphatase